MIGMRCSLVVAFGLLPALTACSGDDDAARGAAERDGGQDAAVGAGDGGGLGVGILGAPPPLAAEDAAVVMPDGPAPKKLPKATEPCPKLVDGDMMFIGRKVRIWVDPDAKRKGPGPIIFYWHGTNSNPGFEAPVGLGPALQDTVDAGGVVAGFYSEPGGACADCVDYGTGNGVWFLGDFRTADEVLACAIEQLNIDTRRIHTAGMSAGGLQASAMVYARSSYLASAVSYSGGKLFVNTFEDKSNKLPVLFTHGGVNDVVLLGFKMQTEQMADELAARGQFVIVCDHGMGHTIPLAVAGGPTAQFFADHPFGQSPEPYADGLPSTFPDYCKVWPAP